MGTIDYFVFIVAEIYSVNKFPFRNSIYVVVLHVGSHGDTTSDEINSRDIIRRSDKGCPWLKRIVNKQVGFESLKELRELGLGGIEGLFEERHEMERETFGGVEFRREVG